VAGGGCLGTGICPGEPVGWAAFGPREGYIRLEHSKSLARVDETPVWSLVCFYVARGCGAKG